MPTVQAERLERLATTIFERSGAPPEHAALVAAHLVEANLAGHDSHGVILLPTYTDRIKKGHIVPGARFEIVREGPTTARINGNWGFGQVVSERAMQLAIDKAKTYQVAAVTVFHQSHVGRVGDYPLMATRAGMIGLMTADSGKTSKAVAPFGGRVARLGTNPICIALPSDLEGPVFIDMATSAVAAGKINVARNRKEQVPLGWIVDKEGNPTTDPNALRAGGAILPVGGDQGHKGYGLSFMVETLSGILTGLGFGIDPQGPHNDGVFMAVFAVDAFRPLEEFKQEIADFVKYIKETPPAAGFQEVLYPGEIEYRTEQRRSREGIPIEDETWRQLTELAEASGIRISPTR